MKSEEIKSEEMKFGGESLKAMKAMKRRTVRPRPHTAVKDVQRPRHDGLLHTTNVVV